MFTLELGALENIFLSLSAQFYQPHFLSIFISSRLIAAGNHLANGKNASWNCRYTHDKRRKKTNQQRENMKNAKILPWKTHFDVDNKCSTFNKLSVFANENEMENATGSWVKFLAHIQVRKTMIFINVKTKAD